MIPPERSLSGTRVRVAPGQEAPAAPRAGPRPRRLEAHRHGGAVARARNENRSQSTCSTVGTPSVAAGVLLLDQAGLDPHDGDGRRVVVLKVRTAWQRTARWRIAS